jgi:hypothetical protein
MKFPGSRLLRQWDLSVQPISLEDILRSCRQVGLTGLAEAKLRDSVGLIFYHLGGEVNALFRDGAAGLNGQQAMERLREKVAAGDGVISIYELPLDLAHLLRGITNRQRLQDRIADRNELADLLRRLEKSEHTGTLELQTETGAAVVLFVRGRASNTYWEAKGGLTFEKGEARHKLDDALGPEPAQLFLSDFSRDVWKTRHEVQTPALSRLQLREEPPRPLDQLAAEEAALRAEVLAALAAEVPSLLQAVVFDLMTGAVYVRTGRGAADIRVGPLAEQIPSLTRELHQRLEAAGGEDGLEMLELTAGPVSILVAVVTEAQEAIAVVADRAQPTALVAAALARSARSYATQRGLARLGRPE